MWKLAALAVAVLLGLVGFLLFTELNQTKASLDRATVDLQETAIALDTQMAANGTLELSLAAATANLDTLTAVNASLELDNSALLAAKAGLETANGELELSLADALAERAEIQQNLDDAAQAADDLRQRYGLLFQENKDLRAEYATLQGKTGTAGALERRLVTLRDDIADLEERRKPLILALESAATGRFRCTGSMEPTITCLDEAVWLHDFRPADVAVGAVIAFYSPAGCALEANGTSVSHRVTAIRVRGETYEFWTQGDAVAEPDGCWVPHTSVTGYIIELHRDRVTQNADLRSYVNNAKVARDAAERTYLDLIERYCGHRDPGRCSLELGPYAQATTAHQRFLGTFNYWKCWHGVALRATPGQAFGWCPSPPPVFGGVPVR